MPGFAIWITLPPLVPFGSPRVSHEPQSPMRGRPQNDCPAGPAAPLTAVAPAAVVAPPTATVALAVMLTAPVMSWLLRLRFWVATWLPRLSPPAVVAHWVPEPVLCRT